ncbi:glutathione peroxidase [Aestuariibacter halophilus]|uniref:Glutathione peroxidase n=1 Tax=Fluctibacter halophilus TaxID=226011 RepID=A0ABS8G7H7_9ALTE|nr:glutathione peroxidase [Aestuariibacter halophilus]MCC2615765.1 glutathione peroxidase [Aestuariibacter halophilus]
MRFPTLLVLLSFFTPLSMANQCPDVLKFVKRKLNSQQTVNFCQAYQGKTLLIVNTASYCGYTPQFEGLEALYESYKDQGLVVLGFPSHEFNQEADNEEKTAELCELTYGVKFPMFEPTDVKGDNADPLYRMLAKKSGTYPSWNFFKYLVDSEGEVVGVYPSATTPEDEDFQKTLQSLLK